jgi:excinuclease UvrABC ATPase subunit
MVVAAGAPEEIITNRKSYTAKYLKDKLKVDGKPRKLRRKRKTVA